MKVLHVPYCYYPDPAGGTEVYVAALAREQRNLGIESAIAAPGPRWDEYKHGETQVFRFSGSATMAMEAFYGEGDAEAARNFESIVECFRPDVLHLHARSQAASVLLVRVAKSRGIPVVFTYHTPAVTCTRGTMMQWGKKACGGVMRASRCAACMLHGKGLPLPLASIAARLPAAIGRGVHGIGLSGRAVAALRSTELIRIRENAVQRMLDEVDHICAVCEWAREVLILNGVSSRKISLTRQGVPYPIGDAEAPVRPRGGPLRLAFLGRAERVKGLQTALAAMRHLRNRNLQFDIFAVPQDGAARTALGKLKREIAGDARIRFRRPLDAEDVISELRNYDALLVPSEWLETGPLVVYEAFAAGIPVLGSNLGGIAELVQHGVNGLLIEPGSPAKWAAAIERVMDEPGLLQRLTASPKPVRSARDTAQDSAAVYAKVM